MNRADTHGDCIVVGLFDRPDDAMDVMRDLQSRGVPASSITIDQQQGSEPEVRRNLIQKLSDFVAGRDTHRYAEGVRRGGTVVSASVPEMMVDDAIQMMENHHAIDIDERTESWRQTGWNEPGPQDRYAGNIGTSRADTDEDLTIPIVEENLKVGKREVQRGRVRVYSRVIEQPVEEQVRLNEERVVVERRPVNRAADDDQALFQDDEFELVERAEEVVVGKEARVVEEVHVGKESRERTETVRDTVRRTDVAVEQEGRQDRGQTHPFASDFQQHFQSKYASRGGAYDQYDPAYRWGYTLANQDEWRGRPWNDVESHAQRTWEGRNPGTWDRFKDAIRYGWDRLTGQDKPELTR